MASRFACRQHGGNNTIDHLLLIGGKLEHMLKLILGLWTLESDNVILRVHLKYMDGLNVVKFGHSEISSFMGKDFNRYGC